MTDVKEADLVKGLKEADPGAFGTLIREYKAMIYRVTRRITTSDPDAEEATQDTFMKIHRMIGRFDGRSSLKTWVYRIAVNEGLMRLRSRSRVTRREILSLDNVFTPEGMHREPVDPFPDMPDDALLAKEVQGFVRKAIDGLPDIYRTVVILADLEERPLSEVTQIMELTLAAVKSRLHRARIHLRYEMAQYLQEKR